MMVKIMKGFMPYTHVHWTTITIQCTSPQPQEYRPWTSRHFCWFVKYTLMLCWLAIFKLLCTLFILLTTSKWPTTLAFNSERQCRLVSSRESNSLLSGRRSWAQTPARPTTRVFKKQLVKSCWLWFETLSQFGWLLHWAVTLSCWPCLFSSFCH